MRPTAFVFAASLPLAFSSLGCSLLHHGASGDGGTDGSTLALSDGGTAAAVTADNSNDVARFPDEVSLNNASAKIGEGHVAVHNSVPGGTTVATLGLGADVVQIASHEGFILCTFTDPKNASRTLEGWVPQAAFGGGGSAPSPKGGCPAGQSVLVGPDQKDFCGKTCKVDKDCPTGETCAGKATLLVAGKPGAETSTCTIPGGPGPTPTPSGSPSATPATPTTPTTTIAGVQEPPGANGACAAKYIMASDHLCHFECNKNPLQCPPHARCTAHLTTPATPVCEPNP